VTQTLAPGATDAADLTAAATTMQAVALSLGAYGWDSTVTVGDGSALDRSTVQNVEIAGEVGGTSDSIYPVSAGALITYTGAPMAGAMLDAEGPIRIGLRNLTLDAVNKAAIGLDLKHVFHGVLADVNVLHATTIGIRQSAYQAPANTYTGGSVTTMHRVAVSMLNATGAKAFYIGNESGGPGLDVSRCAYYDCTALTGDDPTSAGFVLGFVDNSVLYNPFAYSAGARRSVGLLIKPQAGNPAYPCNIGALGGVFMGGIGLDNSDGPWLPDTNSAEGIWGVINCGDMNDPNKNLWPESRDLGGHEGINLFTSTAVQLDRHQPEVYRDRFISYGLTAPQPFRKSLYTPVTGTTAWTLVWSMVIPANYFRVFNRMPHANAYLLDRQLWLPANLVFFNNTGAQIMARLRATIGPTGVEKTITDTGDLPLDTSPYYRFGEAEITIQARQAALEYCSGVVRIFQPGSGGGATMQPIDPTLHRGGAKSGLDFDTTAENTLRVEMKVSNPAALAGFNFGVGLRI